MPAAWTALAHAHTAPTAPTLGFSVNTVAGSTAFGQYTNGSATDIGAVDLTTGRLTRISTLPAGAGGVGWMSAELPWLVWEQLDDSAEMKRWSVRAWNQSTNQTVTLATSSLPDGSLVIGPQPIPSVHHGRAVWAQPIPSADPSQLKAEVMVVDLAAGHSTVLASGRVASPTFAGSYLAWAEYDGTRYSIKVVDADTLQPTTLPAQAGTPASISHLAGSPDYLAWSSVDFTELTVWHVGTAEQIHVVSHDGRHFFQFMQFASHFLVWFAASASSVMDLNTGNAFDVQGSVSGTSDSIVLAETPANAGKGGGLVPTRVSRVSTSSAPAIPDCH
jgi:hypothetical protein